MFKFIHHYWAFVVTIMLLITFIKYFIDYTAKKNFDINLHFRLALFTLIVYYFQIGLGVINWFTSHYFTMIQEGHIKAIMKNSDDRFRVVEHPFMMIIGILLLHYGFNRMKKAQTGKKRFMPVLIFYGINILFILILVIKGLFG